MTNSAYRRHSDTLDILQSTGKIDWDSFVRVMKVLNNYMEGK